MTDQPTKQPTRVALHIADGPGPAYLAAAVEAVMQVDGAEVVLIFVTTPRHDRLSARRHLRDRIDAAYEWLERRALRGGPAALGSRGPVRSRDGVQIVLDASHAAQVDALRAARVDVLIDLAGQDAAKALPVPPAGRWSLSYAVGVGGERRPSMSRPGESMGLAESLLSIELDDGRLLESGVGISGLRRVGFGRDRDAIYWRSSLLAARRLTRLVTGESVPAPSRDGPARNPEGGPSPVPGRWASPPFVGLATTIVGKVIERLLYRTGWLVFVRTREADQDPPRDMAGFLPVEAPAGRFYADPFVVAAQDGPRLYVEDCPDGAHRGRISSLRMAPDGRWAFERVALDDQEHRAYPHVIPTPVGLLLTPDGGRSGGVDLFVDLGPDVALQHLGRCLEGVSASDPTVLWHDGRYWLFVTVTGPGMSPWDELHLYSAATPTGVWHPHPRNPVVADVRRARPAGRIFRRGDELIRPGQDCSVAYGRRIVLSAITTLTPDEYEEHPISSIEPVGVPGIERTHTYSFAGSIDVLDGYRRVLRRPRRQGRAR